MSEPKFSVGQNVHYSSPAFNRGLPDGLYTVMRLMPYDGDDHQYRIKSPGEPYERVVKESQLEA